MKKTYHYIYKITNTLNNMIYIGRHSTKKLNDNYFGSGKNLKKDIKLLGKENFIKEILFEFESLEELILKEKELVNEDFVRNENTYNISLGGSSWGRFEKIVSEETREKLRLAKLGKKHSPEHIEKCRQSKIGKKFSVEHCKKIGDIHRGKIVSEETKRKMVETRKLKGNYKRSEESIEKQKLKMKGKTISPEHIEKLRQSSIGKKLSQETKDKIGKGNKGKFVSQETKEKLKNIQVDRKWIVKDNKCLKIKLSEIENYLKEGWVLGRKEKKFNGVSL